MSTEITGKRISELEKLPVEIQANTRFLNTGFDRVAGEIVKSYGLSYSVLSNQILNDVRSMLHLGSMAYEDKWSYSKITHVHDYSHVDAEVFYGPDSERSGLDHQMVDLGTIEISNYNSVKSLHICVPYVKFQKPRNYRVGEVKFVYVSSDNVEYELAQKGYSAAYGWVIPNGKAYNSREYPDANELYGDGQSETFNVPVISGFFRLNPGIDTTDAMKKFQYHNSQVQHKHKIYQKAELGHVDMPASFDLSTMMNQGPDLAAHCGNMDKSPYPDGQGSVNTGQIDISKDVPGGVVAVTGAEIFESEEDDTESYPTHDTLVPVLYIGIRGQGEEVEVRFRGNGGTAQPSGMTKEVGDAMGQLATATRNGYTFSGWTTLAGGGEQIDEDTIVTGAATYYAQYIPATISLQRRGTLDVLDGNVIEQIGNGGCLESSQELLLMNGIEFIFKVNCSRNTDEQCIMSLISSNDAKQIGISSRKFSWNVNSSDVPGNTAVGLSRDYWVKLKKSGNKYLGYVSSDGQTYTEDFQITRKENPTERYAIRIGNGPDGNRPFCGRIDLGRSYVVVRGQRAGFTVS